MQRYYDVAVAALAIEVPEKWLENLLSRHSLPGIDRLRRGVGRRLSAESICHIALIRALALDLGLTVGNSVAVAEQLSSSADDVVTFAGGALSVSARRHALERAVASRLADAVESAPRRPRGRPPRVARAPG